MGKKLPKIFGYLARLKNLACLRLGENRIRNNELRIKNGSAHNSYFITHNSTFKTLKAPLVLALIAITFIATLVPNNSIASSQVNTTKSSTADFDLGTNSNTNTASDEMKMIPNPRTAWYSTGGTWSYRKKIIIDHTKVPNTDQTDFPVLINLASDADLASKAQDDGDDILLTQDDQTTKLSHEIESFNGTTGALVLWVKIPLLSHTYDTTVYIYYGNASATSQQSATAVWSNGYAGVWHLGEASGNYTDSTGNGHTGTPTGSLTQGTSSPVNKGFEITSSDNSQYVSLVSYDISTVHTIEVWANAADVTTDFGSTLMGGDANNRIQLRGAHNGYWTHNEGTGTGYSNSADTWYRFSIVRNGNEIKFYQNDSLIRTGNLTLNQSVDLQRLGSVWSGAYFKGKMSQFVESSGARSADWIATEYANQNDPASFYSLQSETAKTSVNIASNNISTDWYQPSTGSGQAWLYRRQIVIDHTKVPNTDQSEFPMLVKIADSTDPIFTKAQADGDDILFTNAYGSTKLSHEIETFNTTTKELWAWVKIPTLKTATDTTIWLYYGNAAATSQQNATNVWSNGYAGTWHLGETSGSFTDSTVNNNSGIDNVSATGKTGKISSGQEFAGGSDRITIANNSRYDTLPLTINLWVRLGPTTPDWGRMIEFGDGWGEGKGWSIFTRSGTFEPIFNSFSAGEHTLPSGPTLSTDTWYQVSLTMDAVGLTQFYINGVPRGSSTLPAPVMPTGPLNIGYSSDGRIIGYVDETRISSVTRSADWIATEYANQNAPETFASISKEAGYYPAAGTAGWYSTGGTWTNRQAVTIDKTKVSNSDQTDFPVLVKIANQSNGVFAGAQADGDDILFTSSNGTTKLSHEIETYTTTAGSKALWAWVKVPILSTSTDTVLYMYYGNASANSQQNATDVWSARANSVYHMGSSSSLSIADSTGANNGTSTDVSASQGRINGAGSFNGASSFANIGKMGNFGSSRGQGYYLSSWIYSNSSAAISAITGSQSDANGKNGMSLSYNAWSDNTLSNGSVRTALLSNEASAKLLTGSTNANNITTLSWHYVVVGIIPSTNTISVSVDGSAKSVTYGSQQTPAIFANFLNDVYIGAANGSTLPRYANAYIDEVRYSLGAIPSGLATTEYNNQNSPETFESFGMEQSNVSYASPTSTTAGAGIIDTTWNGGWGNPTGFSSSVTAPSGTSVNFQMRSSAVGGSTDSDWTAWADLGTATTTGTFAVTAANMPVGITTGTNRYIQTRAVLASTDGSATPTLSDYTVSYLADTTAPTNPTTTTLTIAGSAQTTSTWTNISGAVVATFSGASDGGAGESGLAGYYVYFGTDYSADPLTAGVYQAHSGAVGEAQSYSSSIAAGDDGKYYFLRIKTKDIAGNISSAATTFDFGYDISAPTRPTFISANPAGYTTNNSFSFTWPAGADIKTAGGWYNSSWSSRQQVTFDHTKVPNTDQSDFPVLVKITDVSNELFATAKSNGYDILFTSVNGTTKLSHEIEKYDSSTKELWAWVKLPLLSHETDTKIYMYYGNATATNQQNKTDVWSNGYTGVYHLGEQNGGSAAGASLYNNSVSSSYIGKDYVTNTGKDGKVGAGQNMNNSARIDTVRGGLYPTSRMQSAWVKGTGYVLQQSAFYNAVYFGPDTYYYVTTDTQYSNRNFGLSFDSSQWHHIAWVWNSSDQIARFYMDGVQKDQYSAPGTQLNDGNNGPNGPGASSPVSIGGGYDVARPTAVDEFNVSSARSADWIAAEYANQNSPETFMSVAPSNGGSDIKWYEYKRATDNDWSHTADAATRTVSGIASYQEGANAFYVRSVDNAGNVSSNYQQVTYYYSGVAPAKPTNLSVSPDTSDQNSFTLHWHKPTVGAGDPPVKGYRYSINAAPTMDNTIYVENASDTVTIGPDAYATQQGVNTLYVLSVNDAGNYSLEDSYVASTTFTCQTPALPAPIQASVVDSSDRTLDRWMLTLQWKAGDNMDTNAFDHYVVYRSTNGIGFTQLATTSSTAYIDADNLNNQTTYYYNIKAVDDAGKESAQSTTVNKQPTGKFLTPPTYLNSPDVSNVKSNSSDIAWLTDRSSTSIVKYGKDRNNLVASSGQMDLATSHAVSLMGLDPSSTYYFQVQSLDENRDYSPDAAYSTTYSFQTLQAPAISSVEVTNITLTSADISWETTTVASSALYYGKNSDFSSKVDDVSGANATRHSVKLSDLTHSTKYSFRLLATDIDGNELRSDNYNFETLPMPAVANLKATILSDKARAGAKITWTTNVPTSSIIKYSINGAEEKESTTSKLTTEHEITIDGLKDQTDYKVVASGSDSLGNATSATSTTIRTPNDTRAPLISNIQIETSNVGLNKQDFAQAVISWTTDEPGSSRVEYGLGLSGDNYEKMTNEDTNLTDQHVVIISDLDPTTPYHLKVSSKDSAGNLSSSESQVVISSEVQKSTLRVLLDALTKAFSWIKL